MTEVTQVNDVRVKLPYTDQTIRYENIGIKALVKWDDAYPVPKGLAGRERGIKSRRKE